MGGLTAVDHFFHRVHLIFCNIKGNTGLARSVRLQNTCFCPTVCKDVKYIWLCDLQFTIVCKRVHFLLSGLLSAFSFNTFLSCDKHPTNPLFPIHSVNVRPLPILFFLFFFLSHLDGRYTWAWNYTNLWNCISGFRADWQNFLCSVIFHV